MTQVIIIEKENLKEEVIDDMNNLYKKCKFKKQEDFLELMSWNYKDFIFKLFGKVKGKSHTKFLYKFPDFEKNIYGNISIICLYKDQYYDLDLNLWNEFLNNYKKNISEENFEKTILENENEEEEELDDDDDEKEEEEEKENQEEELDEKLDNENKEEVSEEEELEEEDMEELEENIKDKDKFNLEINEDIKYYSGSELAEDEYYYTSDEDNFLK